MAERAEPITPKPGKSLSALVRLVRQSTLIRLAADNGGQGGQRNGKVSVLPPVGVVSREWQLSAKVLFLPLVMLPD